MNKQHGMSLVELMIGLVLSLTVIAGISSLFLHMQKSNQIQRAMATMADDSSYVQEVLQKEIRRTGGLRSRSDTDGSKDKIFLDHNNVLGSALNFAVGESIIGDPIFPRPANDEFAIRYQLLDENDLSTATASNGSSSCTQNVLLNAGEDPAVTEHVVSVYFYLNGTTLSCLAQRTQVVNLNESSVLKPAGTYCIKNCTAPDTLNNLTPLNIAPTDAPVDLVNNVVRLSLSYGVDDDGVNPPDGAANYYTSANLVPVNKWANVISVRLSVVVRSDEDNLTATPMPYSVEGVVTTPPLTDHHLYKVFTTTIALRNQLL